MNRCTLTVALVLLTSHAVRLPAQSPARAGVLPFVESDPNRQPLRPGSLAPDFSLPLALGCRWQPPEESAQTTGSATAPGNNAEHAGTLHFADFRAPRASPHAGGEPTPGVTILVFWAFWCDTWKDTVHNFKALRGRLEAADAHILVVAVDASQQPVSHAALASGDIWYPVVIDTHGDTTAHYGVRRVPTFFVIAADGHIRACYEAFPGERALLQAVRSAGR